MANVIPLFSKILPLTPLMVKALVLACKMQSNNEPFGQVDLHGAFTGLLRRGCIDAETIISDGEKMVSWYVTRTGKISLEKLGYNFPC